ncbi:unnamed protein product [Ectocarpus sp. 6 AP-2014]
MSLSTAGVAGGIAPGGGGAGMAMGPGMAFGGTGMGTPSTFRPPPSAPRGGGDSCCGGGGGGGGYDLRAAACEAEEEELDEDTHTCLGVDVGTSSIKACLYLKDGGCKTVGGKAPLPAGILVDRKTGVKGVRRWLKSRAGGGQAPAAPAKGVKLFHAVGGGGGGKGNNSSGSGSAGAADGNGAAVVWPLRLLALRGKGAEATQRVQSSLRHDIKVSSVESKGATDDQDDGDTSGVRVLLTSPDAAESKDREVWVTPEEVLAMLLAGVKAKAEEAHGVMIKTCNLSAPGCLGDLHRVALQRSVFLAGMVPGRFVGSPLAAAVGYLWGRSNPELKGPDDLILAVGMGASFLDVSLIAPTREALPPSADSADTAIGGGAGGSGGKKKKGKGGGNKGKAGQAEAQGMEYRVRASAGDSACGGLDMDYLVARALLAAVEDSSGPEVASDRALWRNLLDSAKLLRERLSADPKSSVSLKPGCCDADPAFKHSLELSQVEMESAIAGTTATFRNTLQTVLDRAGATAGEVKTVVLYGSCAKTPALLEEVVKMFLDAQIEHPGVGDCAKGAALLLAGSRGLLNALPVTGHDALSHKLGLVDRSKKGAEAVELFPTGSRVPSSITRQFSRKSAGSSGLAVDLEIVEWMEGDKSGERGSASSGGTWVTVQRLGNPLAMQDDRGYPVLAEEVTTLFSLDECGICVNEVESSVLPKKAGGPGSLRRLLNQALIVSIVFGLFGGGYWLLYRLEHAGERRQASARIRLTSFYEQASSERSSLRSTVEDALARYKGREDILFQRLKKQYGKPIPV